MAPKWHRWASITGVMVLVLIVNKPSFAQIFYYSSGTASPILYATQAVQSASTVFTASGDAVSLGFTPIATAVTSTNLTYTLDGNLTFASAPTTTCQIFSPFPGGTCSITSASNPVGSNRFVITIQYATTGISDVIVTLAPGWTFTNATALQTDTTANPLNITETSTDETFTCGCTNSLSAQFASSATALVFNSGAPTLPGFTSLTIDVGVGGLGKQFIQGDSANPDTALADLGSITIGTGSSFAGPYAADGATPYSFGSTPSSVTLAGNFSGIASAYIAPQSETPTTSCAAIAPPGSFPGTLSPSSISFPNIPISTTVGGAQEVCLIANGTSLIATNPVPAGGGNAIPASVVVGNFAKQDAAPQALQSYNYNGAVQQISYSGNFAAYPMYARVVNNTSASQTILMAVQSENGSTGITTAATLAANRNALLPVSTLLNNAGVVLDATGRASLLFLTKGEVCGNNNGGPVCPVSISQLVLNPNGTVAQLGSGISP